MQLVYKDACVFRILDGVVEIGDEKILLAKCRTDWLEAFSGQLNQAPRYKINPHASWFRKLNYTAPEILAVDYIKPYEEFAWQLGYDRFISTGTESKTRKTVLDILKACRKLSY